jgi:hypothetical protein
VRPGTLMSVSKSLSFPGLEASRIVDENPATEPAAAAEIAGI